jgi:hypothetical protein
MTQNNKLCYCIKGWIIIVDDYVTFIITFKSFKNEKITTITLVKVLVLLNIIIPSLVNH